GVQGICIAGCGTSNAATIQIVGPASCVFDGAITAGDYAQISASIDGDCTDSGPTPPSAGGEYVGNIASVSSGGPGTYKVNLTGPNSAASTSINALLKQ